MSRKKVVVVLPAYNAAKTLERTVREVPEGAADAFVLTDDASGDTTVEIARRLGLRTLVHETNRVVRGAIFDVAVDLRRSSPTFGQHVAARSARGRGTRSTCPRASRMASRR